MAIKPWLYNGKPIMINGRKVYCENCPCDADCEEKLSAVKTAMDQDPEWRFIQEARAGYTCPVDVSDSMSDSTEHYTGVLIVIMARNLRFADGYRYAVHALEYERIADGVRKVFFCQCRCGDDWRYVELEGYGIAGIVYADNIIDCRPADLCEVWQLELDYLQGIFGGTLYGEGFFDWLGDNDDFHYVAFKKAYVFEADESSGPTTQKLAYIDCACNRRATVRWKGGEIAVHNIEGFCESPCADLLVLRERALLNGWTWHDEGFILCEAYSIEWNEIYDEWGNMDYQPTSLICDDWYDDYRPCMGCADDGQNWHFVDCSCEWGIQTVPKKSWDLWDMMMDMYSVEPPGSAYLDCDWACSCSRRREVWMAWPEYFGIDNIFFSTDSLVQYGATVALAGSLFESHENRIDYRVMYAVRKRCAAEGEAQWALWQLPPPGSLWGEHNGSYYDKPTYEGQRIPFGRDTRLTYNDNRLGNNVSWWGICSGGEAMGFPTEEEARDYVDHYILTDPDAAGLRDYFQEAHTCITEPITATVDIPGSVWEDGGWWYGRPPQRCFDGPTGYYGRLVYCINWLDTNRGLLLNGVGYFDEWTIYGIQGAHGDPDWGDMFGHSGVPYQDELIRPWVLDKNMHWCIPGFEYDPFPGSDSGSQSG